MAVELCTISGIGNWDPLKTFIHEYDICVCITHVRNTEQILSLFNILIIAFGLSFDAFAVSLSAGAAGNLKGRRSAIRLSFHFGLFQFLMPVIGWLIGYTIAPLVKSIDHWIAFALLAYIGTKMIMESFHENKEADKTDPSKGTNMVMLSVATSIDALAVGFSFAMLGITIWYPSIMIGIITGVVSVAGIYMGKILGSIIGKRMEFIGGLTLIGIGVHILLSNLF